jgi:hypothetical protein
MPEELRPITEPTRLLQSLVEKAACIIYTLETRLEEKPFRGYLVKTGRKSGRILMMPGINREMMERLIDIDYEKLHRFTKKVIRSLRGAACVEVENPAVQCQSEKMGGQLRRHQPPGGAWQPPGR